MTLTTETEKKALLRLFKDFTVDYNPSSISKIISKTRVASYKALKSLEEEEIVVGKDMGKARFYKVNYTSEYAMKNIELLLMKEARGFRRWLEEFRILYPIVDIAILFGSTVRNEKKANDTDILLVYSKRNDKKVNQFISDKNNILLKQIHLLRQTSKDLENNLEIRDKVILSAIRDGIVLYGYEKLVQAIKDVAAKK